MYGLIWLTDISSRLKDYEVFTMLTSALCHDLDHPGYNNAYQVIKKVFGVEIHLPWFIWRMLGGVYIIQGNSTPYLENKLLYSWQFLKLWLTVFSHLEKLSEILTFADGTIIERGNFVQFCWQQVMIGLFYWVVVAMLFVVVVYMLHFYFRLDRSMPELSLRPDTMTYLPWRTITVP